MSQLWPVVITLVSVAPLWLMGRGHLVVAARAGLAAQVVWVVWAVATRQWFFIANAGIYTGVYWANLRRALDER